MRDQIYCESIQCNYINWANEASPTWMVHLRFFIYYYYRTYVGVCVTPFFFFLRRALCAVQSSCTVLFRCARPTHALHASGNYVFASVLTVYTLIIIAICKTCKPTHVRICDTIFMHVHVHVVLMDTI